jgi:hypothetical protein
MDERYPLAQLERDPRDNGVERSPPPGRLAVVLAALLIGLLLMGIQLWLLTVALELYLGGHGRQVWQLALTSGLIFLGGLLTLRLLGRHPPEPLG